MPVAQSFDELTKAIGAAPQGAPQPQKPGSTPMPFDQMMSGMQKDSARSVPQDTTTPNSTATLFGASKPNNKSVGAIADRIGTVAKTAGDFFSGAYNAVKKPIKSIITAPETIISGGQKAEPGTYQGDVKTALDDPNAEANGVTPLNAALKSGSEAVLDVATLGEGASLLKKFGPEATKYLSEKGASFMDRKAVADTLDVVAPKLSKKETEEALAQGRGKAGSMFSKTTIAPDRRTVEVADAVRGLVKKGASGAENIGNVRQALSTEAEHLKDAIKAADHPYSFKELNAKMSAVEPPISIKGTAFERQIGDVKQAAIDIAKKNGGKVSSLLDTRKEFDALVNKEYPNLYDRENAPMRNAITAIRNTMNDFIEQNLPDNVAFKNSLKTQSLYYDAIDNIAGNTASEVGKTGFQSKVGNFVAKHPILSALGAGEVIDKAKDIPVVGKFIP